MASNLLNQPLKKHIENLSEAVKRLLKEKRMKQSELAKKSGLSKYVISRIVNNTNGRGGEYKPSDNVIMMLAVGFQLSSVEATEQLFYAAYPEKEFWPLFLDKGMNIIDINTMLYDNELPMLGNFD